VVGINYEINLEAGMTALSRKSFRHFPLIYMFGGGGALIAPPPPFRLSRRTIRHGGMLGKLMGMAEQTSKGKEEQVPLSYNGLMLLLSTETAECVGLS